MESNNIMKVKINDTEDIIIYIKERKMKLYWYMDTIEKKIDREFEGRIKDGDIYKRTNLFMIIGADKEGIRENNIVNIWDDHRQRIVEEIEFKNRIVTSKFIDEKNIIVITERRENGKIVNNELLMYSIENRKIENKKIIYNNSLGIISHIKKDKENIIATTGKNKGEVMIWYIESNKMMIIKAHEGDIRNIKLSKDGEYMATTSENGTNIHIYDINENFKKENTIKKKLRRGTNIYEKIGIYDICFSEDKKNLACCSTNGTIHIFDIDEESNKNEKMTLNIIGKVSDYFSSEWSYIKHYIDKNITECKCIFKNNDLYIITQKNIYIVRGTTYEKLEKYDINE